jgi:alcohol dehydrogenase
VIDAAKGVALLAANGGRILDYEGIDRIEHPIPPLIMMPSTSGTGADVSQFCIVTDTERHTKITIMGRALVPDVSVIDPRLLVTMPDWLNAATGLDALTHGIEAFVSLARGPLTDHHALQAVSLVGANLARTMHRPEDTGARSRMAQAALEAGLAFTNAILGATHAMSHQVGGMLDLPHGVVNGVLLPHVIRYNGAESPERFVPIAQAMGLDVAGAPAEEAVEQVAAEVRRLADEVGVPCGLGKLGVRIEDVPRLAELTLGDACLTTNPRATEKADVEKLFREAL